MPASNTDKFIKSARKWSGQIGGGGISDAVVTSFSLASTTNLPTDTAVQITVDRVDANGAKTPSKEEVIRGVVSGTNIINCVRGVAGTAQAHSAGAVVEIMLTSDQWNRHIDGILAEHNQDGTHAGGAVATPTHVATSKATPVDADEFSLIDSAASWVLKKLTWANLKATFFADNVDTNGALTANSDSKIASQKAVKTYIDTGKNAESYIGTSASNLTTTSSTLVQIGSAEVTIVTKGGKVLVTGMAPLKESVGAANGYLGIIVDGSSTYPTIAFLSATTRAIVYQTVLTLAAGSHTIKLGFKIDSAETLTLMAYNSHSISAVEL